MVPCQPSAGHAPYPCPTAPGPRNTAGWAAAVGGPASPNPSPCAWGLGREARAQTSGGCTLVWGLPWCPRWARESVWRAQAEGRPGARARLLTPAPKHRGCPVGFPLARAWRLLDETTPATLQDPTTPTVHRKAMALHLSTANALRLSRISLAPPHPVSAGTAPYCPKREPASPSCPSALNSPLPQAWQEPITHPETPRARETAVHPRPWCPLGRGPEKLRLTLPGSFFDGPTRTLAQKSGCLPGEWTLQNHCWPWSPPGMGWAFAQESTCRW